MELSDKLCQVLQCQTQDILTAMRLVSSTKEHMQTFKDDKWDDLLTNVTSFCELRSIDMSDMTARYVDRRGLARISKMTLQLSIIIEWIFLVLQ